MTVLLNKWNGKRFENITDCTECRKMGTVKRLVVWSGGTPVEVRICRACLQRYAAEIDEAVLLKASRPKRKEGN